MRILEYFSLNGAEQARVREAIGRSDWRAAAYLREKLERGELRALYGESTRVLLGTEGDRLAAFCTLAERDDVADTVLTPWIGFVYVFPAYRGCRRSGELIESACALARRDGHLCVYLSSREDGLYEKYGFEFVEAVRDAWGEATRVYRRALAP